jgi:hypothetical protein
VTDRGAYSEVVHNFLAVGSPAAYGVGVDLDDIDAVTATLDGCKRKGHPGRVAWYVDNRLVVRQDEPGTVLVRVDFADRERLLAEHPETFGVPPRWEKHQKVQADLDGDAGAISEAIRLAWQLQRTQG